MSNADGGPAFPSHGSMGEVAQEGLSLLDYFAGQALLGFALAVCIKSAEPVSAEVASETCYKFADAMIAQRDRLRRTRND